LNPIELIWSYLKKKVICQTFKNLDEVLARAFEEWYNLPLEVINNLIDGHQAQVKEVYDLNGAFI